MRHTATLLALWIGVAAAQQAGSDPATWARDAQRALAERRYADAVQALEKLRQADPKVAEVHAQLGLAYYQQGAFAQAIGPLREALRLKPTLPRLDILLAMSLSEVGQFTEALPGLEKGYRQAADAPVQRMAGLQLLRAYTALAQDEKAVEVALAMRKRYRDDPEVLYHCSRLFGNFAYLTLRDLAEVAPESPWRRQAAGEAFESQGQYDRAIAEYRRVLEANPQRAGIHYRIGRSLLGLSAQPEAPATAASDAMREFARELELDPTNANAAYELGELQRKAEDFGKARQSFETALKYAPGFEDAEIGLGRVLLAEGKAQPAVEHLRKATTLNPNSPVAYFHLAQAYRAAGNQPEQTRALAEFRRLQAEFASKQQSQIRGEVTRQDLGPQPNP